MTDEERIENNPSQNVGSQDEPQDLGDPEQEQREYLEREQRENYEREYAPLLDSHMKSVGDTADGGGTVVGTGMRLADDRSWEARYNDMMARRKAERAGLKAQSLARQELLDTGKYFDDGRGNIKLKQGERKRRERFGRGWHEETEADNGAGMRYIQKAGQDAYNGSMNGWTDSDIARYERAMQRAQNGNTSLGRTRSTVAENKAALEMMKQRKADEKTNYAKGMLSVYDGLVSAYKSMLDADPTAETVAESGPRQFKKGADGKVTTEMEPRKMVPTGKRFKNGYVMPEVIQSINDNLAQRGNRNFRITGIIARQQNDDVRGDVGKPMFYVRGKRWDASQGKSVPFGKVMTMQDVYRLGVDSGVDSGMNEIEAEWNVANGFSDVFGRLAGNRVMNDKTRTAMLRQEGENRRSAERNAMNLLIAELQEAGRNGRHDKDIQQKQLKLIADYTKATAAKGKDGNSSEILKHMPPRVWNALLADRPALDENGKQMIDPETDKPVMRKPTADEVFAALDRAKEWMVENFGTTDGAAKSGMLLDLINRLNGNAPQMNVPVQVQGGLRQDEIDPNNIKGTGISFTDSDRLKVPVGREKEFEAYMDGIAALYNPFDHEEGKKIVGKDPSRPSSGLVPKDWREKIGKGDFDRDYDFVAAFLAGAKPSVNQEDGAWHMGDVGKLPTHPSFSNESYYARNPKYAPLAGRWEGETYIPGEAERRASGGNGQPQQSAPAPASAGGARGLGGSVASLNGGDGSAQMQGQQPVLTIEQKERNVSVAAAEVARRKKEREEYNARQKASAAADRQSAYEAEDARRRANAINNNNMRIMSQSEPMQGREPQQADEPPKYTAPLSKTRLGDMPAALLHKVGRAIVRGQEMQNNAEAMKQEAMNKAVNKGVELAGKGAKAVAGGVRKAMNATPETIGNKLRSAAESYGGESGDAGRGMVKNANGFAERIKRNIKDMEERSGKRSEADEDRNRFYANREGRNADMSLEERKRLQDEKDRSQDDTIRPRYKSGMEWLREKIDWFHRADGEGGNTELAKTMKDLASKGKAKAVGLFKRMMEDDGVDTSEMTPEVENKVFEKILEMTSPVHALNAQRRKLKKQGQK